MYLPSKQQFAIDYLQDDQPSSMPNVQVIYQNLHMYIHTYMQTVKRLYTAMATYKASTEDYMYACRYSKLLSAYQSITYIGKIQQ